MGHTISKDIRLLVHDSQYPLLLVKGTFIKCSNLKITGLTGYSRDELMDANISKLGLRDLECTSKLYILTKFKDKIPVKYEIARINKSFFLLKLVKYTPELELYKTIFDQSTDMLSIVDRTFICLYHNKALSKSFKYPDNVFINISLLHIVESKYVKETRRIIQNIPVLKSDMFVTNCVTSDGQIIKVEWRITCLKDDEIFIVMRDITRADNFNNVLMDSKDAAEHASAMKSIFVANMSHEIRTPINAIVGMATLLKLTNVDAEQQECVDIIINSSGVLLSIINNVLDISKIEAGADIELNPAEFSLRQLCEEIRAYYSKCILKPTVQFNVIINDDVPDKIVSDKNKLQQVITNLVNNSLKFTDAGYVKVRISKSGKITTFKIEDTGIGIDKESQKTLFKPFVQARRASIKKYGGSGLGLAICKHIVDLMSGEIHLYSNEGQGTCVTLDLPLVYNDKRLSVENKKRVVIIEDNFYNQIVLKKMLEKIGFSEIEVYNDGLQALEGIKTIEPKVIFVDLHMPKMDGYECVTILREKRVTCPIIAVTANAMSEEDEKCKKLGMNGFILKPINFKTLSDIITQLKIDTKEFSK